MGWLYSVPPHKQTGRYPACGSSSNDQIDEVALYGVQIHAIALDA